MIHFAKSASQNVVQQRDLPSMTVRDAGLTSGAFTECSQRRAERRTER